MRGGIFLIHDACAYRRAFSTGGKPEVLYKRMWNEQIDEIFFCRVIWFD